MSDEELIKGCRRYNRRSQRELFDKYYIVMKSICMRYSDNNFLAEDLMQEGFLTIFSKIKKYSGKGSFEGWMKRIMINTVLMHHRKNKNKPHHESLEVASHSLRKEESETPDDLEEQKLNFSHILRADFSEKELMETLSIVPEHYRQVFNLYCIDEYKHQEIAEQLDIDVKTSRTRFIKSKKNIDE